jgi:hypothetical protein
MSPSGTKLALIEKEFLAHKLSRPKLALINPSGISGRRPKTGKMDTSYCMHYTYNSKRVTWIDKVVG